MAKELIEVSDHVLRFVYVPEEENPNITLLQNYVNGTPTDTTDVLHALAEIVLQQQLIVS